MKTIIRWAGSKRKLMPMIQGLFPEQFGQYVEPFCGSACLFFETDAIHSARLSDINPRLINAYVQLRNHPVRLYNQFTKIPNDPQTYLEMRKEFNSTKSAFRSAILFFYLNRNCFNGVYRTNRKGEFNVPKGSKTGHFPSKSVFLSASMKLKNAELSCLDFASTLESVKKNDLVYLDPPYTTRGKRSQGEYGPGAFDEHEIDRLISSLDNIDSLGAKFILSYKADDNVSAILREKYVLKELSVQRHVAGFAKHRALAKEIIATNY